MGEDELVNRLISEYRGGEAEFEEIRIQPEVHYNYYGDRGVVDLHVVEIEYFHERVDGELEVSDEISGVTEKVYEIKGDAAIQQATGANEIIRQFRRHCDYFYRDENRSPHRDTWVVNFELCFVATPVAWEHVRDNFEMYRELEHAKPYLGEGRNRGSDVMVSFRHPDEAITRPVLPMRDSFPDEYREWPEYQTVIDALGV